MFLSRYSVFRLLVSSHLSKYLLCCSLWMVGNQMGWASVPFKSRTLVSLPKQLVTGTLPNGLRYMLMPNAQPSGRAEIRLVLNVGSAAEKNHQHGHAHFIEHLAFGGTKSYPQREMVSFWEQHGMKFGQDINAMTGYDRTVYQTAVPSLPNDMELLEQSLPMVAEWLDKISILPQKVEQEKGIIQEEIRAYNTNDDFFSLKHGKGAYARLPIGTPSEVAAITSEGLRQFYTQWYDPNRATLIVVGAIDADKLQEKVKNVFGKIPAKSSSEDISPFKYDKGVQVMVLHDELISSTSAELIVPHRVNPQRTMGDALEIQRGKLLMLLAERRLRALGMRSSLSDAWYLGNINHFTTSVGAPDVQSLRDSVRQVAMAFQQMVTDGWCGPELRSAKRHFIASMQQKNPMRARSSAVWCDDFIDYAVVGDRYFSDSLQWQQLITGITETTSADLQRMLKRWMQAADQSMLVAVRTNRIKQSEESEAERSKLWEWFWKKGTRGRRPHYEYREVEEAASQEVKIPKEISTFPAYDERMVVEQKFYSNLKITDARLKNGLRIVLKPTPSADSLMHISVIAPQGTASIPIEKYNLLEGTAGYMDMGGTRSLPAEALPDFQMSHGITLITSMEHHWHGFLGQTATKNSRLFYNFLREKWLYPELRYNDFEDVRQELLEQHGKETTLSRMLHRSPEHLINQEVDKWAGHVLPFTAEEPDSLDLKRMKLDDMAEFYHNLYAPTEQTTIIVTGTFDAQEELKRIAAVFSQLPAAHSLPSTQRPWATPSQSAETWLQFSDNAGEKTELLHIERLWSGQYEPGLRSSLVLKLMRDALRQRVIEIVREKEGLVYSPYVSLFYDASPWAHFLMDVSLTAAPNQRKKIQEVMTEIEKNLKQVPLSEAELAQLKRPFLIAKNDELAPDDAAAWRMAIERLIKNEESLEDFNRYEEVLDSIRPEDVQRGFQTLIQQQHWLFLAE